MGGRFLLGASAAARDAAGIAAGQTHTVAVELDTETRQRRIASTIAKLNG